MAGGWGETTVADRTTTWPPVISKLEYEFDSWLGDDLVACFACYIVTERLRNALDSSGLTGFGFDDMTITTSIQFQEWEELYNPPRILPTFYWLKVSGQAGKEDFGIENTLRPRIPAKASRPSNGKKVNIKRRGYMAAPLIGNYRLVVSERALSLLRSFQLENCLVLRFHP